MTDRIAFIGIGNIAQRIIAGLIKSGVEPQRIVVAEHNRRRLQAFCAAYPGLILAASNREAVADAATTVACVKPNDMRSVCAEIAPALNGLFMSTAAGVPIARLSEWTQGCRSIARCMPNTPVSLLQGAVGLYAAAEVSADSRRDAQSLFARVAAVFWLDKESDMNAMTALCGSGPGYFLALAEQLAAIARDCGFADTQRFAAEVLSHGAQVIARFGAEDTDALIAHCAEYPEQCGLANSEDERMFYAMCLSCVAAFVTGLKKAAAQSGFAPSTATAMVHATLSGSAALAADEGDAKRLYAQVASKGGTTAEGIKVLKEANLKQLLAADARGGRAAFGAQQYRDAQALAQRMFHAAQQRAAAMEAEVSA